MPNQKLKLFINAAYYLNFTKAADVSHVTQATMSRQIKALEEEIGAPLFLRTQNGVSLTKAGNYLYHRVLSYLEQYNDIVEGCRKAALLPFSKLRLATGPYCHLLISEPLRALLEKYPAAQYNYMGYTYNILASRFKNRSVDFALCTRACAEAAGGLTYTSIYAEPWLAAAHRDSPFWSCPESERRSLYGQRVVTLYQDNFEPVRPYCTVHGFHPAEFIAANFLHAQTVMLQAGGCIALLPPFVCQSLPACIRTEDVLEDPLTVEFVAAYDPKNPNEGCACFYDICRECFSQEESAEGIQ